VAILGTPGGSRIITMVLRAVLALVEGESVARWVEKPRFHHQYLPDEIQLEADTFDAPQRSALESKGHRLREVENGFGNMQAVYWDFHSGQVSAASDPRGLGSAEVR
jgi:gamma-glutamyltranspeptidase/glutathione hydrolase